MFVGVCQTGKARQTVRVPEKATVLVLKRAIEREKKIPIDEQTLTFNGLILENEKLLSEYDLFDKDDVLLYLRLGFKPDFVLTVLLPNGKKLNLNMCGEDTVSELKKRIKDGITVDMTTAKLIFDHWVLQDDRKLIEYGIATDSTILIVDELSAESSPQDSQNFKHAALMPQIKTSRHLQRKYDPASDDNNRVDKPGMITVVFLAKADPPIPLKVHPGTLLEEVREKLAQKLNIPASSMRFARNGKMLNFTKSFAHYGISNNESVCLLSKDHLVDKPSSWYSAKEENGDSKMRIIVQSECGRVFACYVHPNTQIGALKRRLERELNVSRFKMGIFYRHRMLQDDISIRDLDVYNGTLFYLCY